MIEEVDEPQSKGFLDLAALTAGLWDRRWWLVVPLFACGLGGLLVARSWPYLYQSEALILVEQQRIPESFVASNVVLAIDQRLDQMTQRIMSRSRLMHVIEQFQLYRPDLAKLTAHEIVEKMQSKIRIDLVNAAGKSGAVTAFRVRFAYPNARVAQKVTNELTSMLIDDSISVRAARSAEATSFFEAEVARAREELTVQEERLKEYKTRYVGELPEQLSGNLQLLTILQAQLHAAESAVDRAVQQRVYLEALQGGLAQPHRPEPAADAEEPEPEAAPAPLSPERQELILHRKKLAEMYLVYKPQHPDVKRLEALIADLEGRLPLPEALAAKRARRGRPVGPTDQNRQQMAELEGRMKAINVEIQAQQIKQDKLREEVNTIHNNLNQTPLREQQLSEVLRNYENSKANYQSLLQKKRQSELSTSLEKRQQGERLRVLDQASLPSKPEDPTRLQLIVAGWILGFGLGMMAMIVRELADRRIRGEQDLVALTNLTNLACLPKLEASLEASASWTQRVLEIAWAVMLTGATGVTAALLYWS